MRRELQWEATLARLQQQLAQLKGEGDHKAAEDAAEGQAKQLNSIRSFLHAGCCTIITDTHQSQLVLDDHHHHTSGTTACGAVCITGVVAYTVWTHLVRLDPWSAFPIVYL